MLRTSTQYDELGRIFLFLHLHMCASRICMLLWWYYWSLNLLTCLMLGKSTSSPGNANVPWVRTHVGCYVRYTIPFLLLKQLSLVLCFYTVMWTVCWLRNYMRSPIWSEKDVLFFWTWYEQSHLMSRKTHMQKGRNLNGPKVRHKFWGVFFDFQEIQHMLRNIISPE